MNATNPTVVQVEWKDIDGVQTGYVCRMMAFEHYADFKIWEIIGVDSEGVPAFQKEGQASSPVFADDIEDAEVFLSGSIKWDGCANVQFDQQENCMLHFCGRKHAVSIGMLFDRLYKLASESIPSWDAETAE